MIFSSGMVLQRGKEVPIWGWAKPGTKVSLSFRGAAYNAVTQPNGRWEVVLDQLTAGGPDELGIYAEDDDIILSNVLVGDVWLCSGQSNMTFPVSQSENSSQEIEQATDSRIHMFRVGFQATDNEKSDVSAGSWKACSPLTAGNFSAVGFFFAQALLKAQDIPIGIIVCAWGGSSAEAWLPTATVYKYPILRPILARYDTAKKENIKELLQYRNWQKQKKSLVQVDPGNRGYGLGYHSEKFDDSKWEFIHVPGFWEDQFAEMQIDGAVWYRRHVEIPASLAGSDLQLNLGQISDLDNAYWNGVPVGQTVLNEEDPSGINRNYKINKSLVHVGDNVIAVRVFNRIGKGGFGSDAEVLNLSVPKMTEKVSLAGLWKYSIELSLDPQTITPKEIPFGPGHPQAPSNLYNGMLHPLLPYALTGFVWYQGESNVSRAKQYEILLQSLVSSWRTQFKQGNLPFLIVQLPSYKSSLEIPVDAEWAELRDSQQKALRLTNTAMAVTIDLGNANDIHPIKKKPIGERLANLARALVGYDSARGQFAVFDGYKVENDKIRISFKNTYGSLQTKGSIPLQGFAIAGPDQKFVWAQAKIEGETVVVWSPGIRTPLSVRYGWADNPVCNLLNRSGLPVSPFRTDNWMGLTDTNN